MLCALGPARFPQGVLDPLAGLVLAPEGGLEVPLESLVAIEDAFGIEKASFDWAPLVEHVIMDTIKSWQLLVPANRLSVADVLLPDAAEVRKLLVQSFFDLQVWPVLLVLVV